jgi:Zn-dependent protease
MAQPISGSFRLFRALGIDVYLNVFWFLVPFVLLMPSRDRETGYHSNVWVLVECLGLFGIVLLHEFGHALACRQVGGEARQIVLWPLGGIAFVNPPPRPGAVLWCIAAGPLVNVMLVPITCGLWFLGNQYGLWAATPDLDRLLFMLAVINVVLLGFNLLPIYPLDGGQIVQALLWFFVGRARSLLIVSTLGVLIGAIAVAAAVYVQSQWLVLLAGYAAYRSWIGIGAARAMLRLLKLPRHEGLACPACGEAPPSGPLWACNRCSRRFDTFAEQAVCPGCGASSPTTQCPYCGQRQPIAGWLPSVLPARPGP